MSMLNNVYFIVDATFAIENNNIEGDESILVFRELKNGNWACSANTLFDHCQIFENKSITIKYLTSEDFVSIDE